MLHVKNLASRVVGGEEMPKTSSRFISNFTFELGKTHPACNQKEQLIACVASFQSARQYHSFGQLLRKCHLARRGAKRERDRKEEGGRAARGRREQGEEEGGSPKEGQRISTELGASGGYSENKSRVCCFRDVNQIQKEKS